jgi:hypothetical protein
MEVCRYEKNIFCISHYLFFELSEDDNLNQDFNKINKIIKIYDAFCNILNMRHSAFSFSTKRPLAMTSEYTREGVQI